MTEPNITPPPASGFYGLGIAPKLLDALIKLGFAAPTPIQEKAIPIGIDGKDMIGIAQTGTGKTMAFGVPMIQRLAQVKGKGLITLPTRELALQVEEALMSVGRKLGLRTAVLIGGASMDTQIKQIRNKPHIIVGTPGRIIDHLDRRSLDLGDVSVLVLDEADRMLDMGFMPQIKRILQSVPRERQTMLFSATMPDDIVRIASQHMRMPVRVEVARAGSMTELVDHELFVVRKDQKNRLLEKLLAEYHGTVLVFSRTKFGARRISRAVHGMGHNSAEIHSDRSLPQRREALDGFKSGKYRVLVATDIAARGIDVTGIELVLNYDIPENPEDYVHRIGRTGRAGQAGRAISFATPEQGAEVRDIERLAQVMLPISPLPELPPDRPRQFEERRPFPQRHGGHGGSGHSGSDRPAGDFYFFEGSAPSRAPARRSGSRFGGRGGGRPFGGARRRTGRR